MPRLGLRAKFFLYSNTVIAVTMALATTIALVHERSVRYQAIYERAMSLAEALSIPVTDALMYEDLGLVAETGLTDNYIQQIIARNRDLMRYIVVTDPGGRVTHSNRWWLLGKRFPRAFTDCGHVPGPVSEILPDRERREDTAPGPAGDQVLEVRTPLRIRSKCWGSLAVGFSLAPIEREVRAVAGRYVLIALVLMLGNSVLTAIYVESLIRPLLALHQVMTRAGKGDLAVRADVRRRDEIGELAEAFNRMMEELREARETEKVRQSQLAHMEKMAAIGTLAAGVAHEVNNPLGGILTCLENLRANPGDREMLERYLDLIQDGLKRIERTVANLLGFSRQRPPQPEPTSINHNLRHVVELADYQLRRAGVEVRFQLDPADPKAMADHFQMEQLFLNLVLNAIQAMPDGGVLGLSTEVREGKIIASIADTGVGIPAEIVDRIFEPFFTTREVGKGTGLGLAVSWSIASAHGGSIAVESEVGRGSVFRVILPLLREDDGAEEAGGAEGATEEQG